MAEEASNPPTAAPVSILPQYPELIFAAIEALDSKKGACRSKISKQIEASYASLPAAHKTLLSHHLNKMTASGELVVINNNYIKPDPNSPPRRGRGRPSKPKTPVPEGTVVSPPRSRGRPRKLDRALVPVTSGTDVSPAVTGRKRGRPPKSGAEIVATPAKKASTGKGRGRPKKVTTGGDTTSPPATGKGRGRPKKVTTGGDATSPPATGGKIGRGRPRKVTPAGGATSPAVSGEKKGRGRPRKVMESGGGGVILEAPTTGEKRGRGRPRKVVETEAPVGSD